MTASIETRTDPTDSPYLPPSRPLRVTLRFAFSSFSSFTHLLDHIHPQPFVQGSSTILRWTVVVSRQRLLHMAGLMVPPRFQVSVETFMRISFHLIHSASELRSPPSLGGPVRGARSRVARPHPTRVVELALVATAGVGSPAPSRVDSPFQAGAARRSWRLAPVLWGLPSCNFIVYTSTTLCNLICRDFSTAQRETCSDLGKRLERNLGRSADRCRFVQASARRRAQSASIERRRVPRRAPISPLGRNHPQDRREPQSGPQEPPQR